MSRFSLDIKYLRTVFPEVDLISTLPRKKKKALKKVISKKITASIEWAIADEGFLLSLYAEENSNV